MERKEERVMARQSIFKFNERVTTEAKDSHDIISDRSSVSPND